MNSKIQKIDIRKIRLDGDTQARVQINEQTVAEYAEAIANGEELPAIELYHDGSDYWPPDGFHRTLAHAKAGKDKIAAIVKPGTCSDAAWAALSKNRKHGLRLSRDDREKIAKDAIRKRPEMSDRGIANHVGASPSTIGKYRKELGLGVQLDDSDNSDIDICTSNKTSSSNVPEKRTCIDGRKHPTQQVRKPAPSPEPKPKPMIFFPDPPKAEKPKPDEKSASAGLVDQVGNPLPEKESIRAAFQRRDEITEMMTTVSRLRSRVLKAAEDEDMLFAALTVSQFQADCGNLRRALRAIRPHAVCPYCKGLGQDCKGCLGRGWVGEFVYNSAPKDMRGAK